MEATAPPQTRESISEVFLTRRAVKSSDAAAVVPEGHRMAYPNEVALAYKEKLSFRKALYSLPCAVWANQTGLDSSGAYKIDDNGNFVKVTYEEFAKLNAKDRSLHYPGKDLVAICGWWWGRLRTLDIDAGTGPDDAALVAYVADGGKAQHAGGPVTGLKSIIRK